MKTLVCALATIALCAGIAWGQGKYASQGDSRRASQVAVGQVAPALGWYNLSESLTGSSADTVKPGFVFNVVEFYTAAACSVKLTSDPALVALGWDTAVAVDTFYVGHPRAGEARRDTTFRYVPASSSFSVNARASMLIIKGGGTGNLDGAIWGNP